MKCLSYGLFSRGYREEVFSGYGLTRDAIQGGGTYDSGPLKGQLWMLSTFEISGQGLGASAVRDGLNWGYAMWNPESDLGDVETWELFQGGVPYLARKVKPNNVGHGKYRGGSNYGGVAFVAHSKDVEFFGIAEGLVFSGAGGMHGGYPQPTAYRLIAKNTNLKEIFEKREDYPLWDPDPSNGEFERLLKGDIIRKPYAQMYPIALKNYDMFHWCMSGGPGYGDPLERDVNSVIQDLNDGICTEEKVLHVYGVVATYDDESQEWSLNERLTQEQQKKLEIERKEKSMTFEEFKERERKKLTENQLSKPVKIMYKESLELSDKWAKEFREFWNLPENFKLEVE